MDLDLISPNGEPPVDKVLFNLKGIHNNGLVLQIHPSFVDIHGDRKKFRFLHCSFSENNVLAVSDNGGNIFVIDLEIQKYWQLPHKAEVSIVSFIPGMASKLLIALNKGVIQIIHIETGNLTGVLMGHSTAVRDVSYSYDGKYCLTSNSNEAIIWDLFSCCQSYRLSLKGDMSLKKVLFMPVQSSIFGFFKDDAMNIWKFGSFECVKQIVPDGWNTHCLKTVAFSRNGRVMVIGGYTTNIVVFCLDTWTVKKVIQLTDSIHGIKYMEFIPEPSDGGANKILGLVTNNSELFFLDIETSSFLNNHSYTNTLVGYLSVSPTGKYLASILVSGKVDVYLAQKLILPHEHSTLWQITPTSSSSSLDIINCKNSANVKVKQRWVKELKAVHNELKEELTLKKLGPLLKQFGEYPESYRVIIWRTILQLPMNEEAYMSLANKDCHPSYSSIESQYPLVNKAVSNALKRILSSLAYWCPLFSEVSFLPEFIFPFVKLLHCDPFICFETIATIIVNWCQNWFEFYPFPPINVLTIIENVLGYHDSDLLEFYYEKNVTSCLFACILMQTAFSEVLTKKEWLRLWDHILSNEPSFIIMTVIAYNVICRSTIGNCRTSQDIEDFFHSQNIVDVKLLITKAYHLMEKTPDDIHPRQYLSTFSPLGKGTTYPVFEAYPKAILDRNASKLQFLQKEEQKILEEQRKIVAMKKELDKKLKIDEKVDFREQVLAELDRKFREVVNAEEERISAQRKKLQNLRHELKLKELSVLEEVRDQILKKRSQKKEIEVELLLKDIAARKIRESRELEALEEEVNKYYSSLLLRKYRLKLDLESKEDDYMKNASEELMQKREKMNKELDELQDELTLAYHDKKIEISNKILKITELLKKIELELAEVMNRKDSSFQIENNKREVENLWKKTEALDKRVENLLNRGLKATYQSHENLHEMPSYEKKNQNFLAWEQTQSDTEQWQRAEVQRCSNDNSCNEQKLMNLRLTDPENKELILSNPSGNADYSDTESLSENKKSIIFDKYKEKKCQKEMRSETKPRQKNKTKFTVSSKVRSFGFSSEDLAEYTSDSDCDLGNYFNNGDVKSNRCMRPHACNSPKSNDNKLWSHETSGVVKQSSTLSCETDLSPYRNDQENNVLKMALTERQKLIEEAKRNIPPVETNFST